MIGKRAKTENFQGQFDRPSTTSEIFASLRRALDLTEALISDVFTRQEAAQAAQQQTTQTVAAAEARRLEPYYTIKEVCETTRLGRSTIYKAISEQHLQTQKWGRRTLVSADALQTWIASWEGERNQTV